MEHSQGDGAELAKREELMLKDFILKVRSIFFYLLSKWKIVLVAAFLGAVAGGIYAYFSEKMYSADCTFVMDEGKSQSISGLSALGLDVGKSDAGLFSATDNIIWLYSSKPMLQKALLTPVEREGKSALLVDLFLDATGLKKKNKQLSKVKFQIDDRYDSLTLEKNSILGMCAWMISSKYLKVRAVDKTQNIITVNVTSEDERFAKDFNDCLVRTVNNFYIETMTKKATKEVELLQRKADSFKAKMNTSMYQAADAMDAAPYANPMQQVLRVAPQRRTVDVQLETAIYIEITKNLETSRMNLAKETPLIQVLDAPSLPLGVIQLSHSKAMIMGVLLFVSIGIIVLLLLRWYRALFAKEEH